MQDAPNLDILAFFLGLFGSKGFSVITKLQPVSCSERCVSHAVSGCSVGSAKVKELATCIFSMVNTVILQPGIVRFY